jgi:hypothetical protein
MTGFRCVPIPSDISPRWGRTGVDDAGNRLRIVHADGSGSPCRHCLRDAEAGEALLLGSYRLPRPTGIYWTPSPIFVHADACERYSSVNEVAPIMRNRLVSVRAYDRDDQCNYDLGHAGDGDTIDPALLRALDDPRTAFVNVHTAKPGCMLCRVERA